MKSLRTVRYAMIAAAVAGAAVVSTPAAAGVSATAGVASLYLWRGLNLGGGTPVVMGSLDYAHDTGLYAGVWGSSAGPDQEVDLYAGYAYSSDAFGFKIAGYDYSYPRSGVTGDLQEGYINFSASGFFFDALIGAGDFEENNYYDVGYTYDKFTVKYGFSDADDVDALGAPVDEDYSHADLSYAYNSNLSFTVSGIVDAGDDSAVKTSGGKEALFVVSYVLPLDLK